MTRSESIAELTAALAVAQGAIENAVKDTTNPFFKSKYADLASVRDVIREPFSKAGLAVMQFPHVMGVDVTVTTILAHKSGEWVSCDITMTSEKQTPQAVGSVITYARRYALAAISGVASEDDDGEAATNHRAADVPAVGSKQAAQDVAKEKIALLNEAKALMDGRYGVKGVPAAVLIDCFGTDDRSKIGAMSLQELRNGVNSLKQRPPDTPTHQEVFAAQQAAKGDLQADFQKAAESMGVPEWFPTPFNLKTSIAAFQGLKERLIRAYGEELGTRDYLLILEPHGAKHSNDLKTPARAHAAFRNLLEAVKKAEAPEQDEFEQHMTAPDAFDPVGKGRK